MENRETGSMKALAWTLVVTELLILLFVASLLAIAIWGRP